MVQKRTWQKEFTLRARAAFDLRCTALSHGWYQIPPFEWDDDACVLALAVAGPRRTVRRLEMWQSRRRQGSEPRRTLRLRWRGTGKAPDLSAAGDVVAQGRALARRVLNLGVDLGPFYALCSKRESLAWVVTAGAGRVLRGPTVFSDVVSSICGTNTHWKMAVRSVHRLAELAPLDPLGSLRRYPTPAELAGAGAQRLRDHARVGYRAEYIADLAETVAEGSLDLEAALDPWLSGAELRALFRGLPGIGPITARYLAVLYGRFDGLAVDSLVLKYIGEKYLGGRRATEKEVQAMYQPYGDLRGLAYWFEFLGDVDPVTWRGWANEGKPA
jgi:3-methyladenine DNA glycosylase/8-oxoguanine DNA glycosylase